MEKAGAIITAPEAAAVSPDYVDMLEQINNVHGTGLALASVLIALLACVLTVAGVFAAFLMWRNSVEQKKERQKVQEEHAQRLFEQYQTLVTTYEAKMQGLVERVESIAANAESVDSGMSETKQELEELVSTYRQRLPVAGFGQTPEPSTHSADDIPFAKQAVTQGTEKAINIQKSFVDNLYEVRQCPHCGKEYRLSKLISLSGMFTNTCPHCGGALPKV